MKLEYKFQVGRVLTYSLLHTQGIGHEFNKYLSNESWRRFFKREEVNQKEQILNCASKGGAKFGSCKPQSRHTRQLSDT